MLIEQVPGWGLLETTKWNPGNRNLDADNPSRLKNESWNE